MDFLPELRGEDGMKKEDFEKHIVIWAHGFSLGALIGAITTTLLNLLR